jgi:preprotein translocase subunit SecG
MDSVVLVIHLFLALGIIGLVLMQRSEGGGLGIGGGGGGGGAGNFASPRGTANFLSRMTAICAAAFFTTSLILGILAGAQTSANRGILNVLDEQPAGIEAPMDADADQAETTEQTPDAPMPADADAANDDELPSAPIAE